MNRRQKKKWYYNKGCCKSYKKYRLEMMEAWRQYSNREFDPFCMGNPFGPIINKSAFNYIFHKKNSEESNDE